MSKPSSGYFHGTKGDPNLDSHPPVKSIDSNIATLAKVFPLTKEGYFGEKSSRGKVRIIKSENQYKTAQEFWEALSKGGKIQVLPNRHGIVAKFDDKSMAVYRVYTSTKASPAIEITLTSPIGPKRQKIHFILKDKKK